MKLNRRPENGLGRMHDDLKVKIADIERMSLNELRNEWSEFFGDPPELRSVVFMRFMLAWRLQAMSAKNIDAKSIHTRALRKSQQVEGRQLGIGVKLTRKWKGKQVEVAIEEHGFRWNNQLFASLSAAASAIAGSQWNGPRFFGLRD